MRPSSSLQDKLRARLDKPTQRQAGPALNTPTHPILQGATGMQNPLSAPGLNRTLVSESAFTLTSEEIDTALPLYQPEAAPTLLPPWIAELVSKTMASFQGVQQDTPQQAPPKRPTDGLPVVAMAKTPAPHLPEAVTEAPQADRAPQPASVQQGHYTFQPFSFSAPSPTPTHPATPGVAPAVCTPPNGIVTNGGDVSYDTVECSVDLSPDDGGPMVDLSSYQDLTRPPATGDQQSALSSATATLPPETFTAPVETPMMTTSSSMFKTATHPEMMESEYKVEYSGNVKTLVQLVNDLPEGVTKQTGAQIIRLTMEAMGISMENVLSEAQTAQSELLDAARSNIKKIEEYKTIIRKLETESRFHQGKANELSEIIDLFILSNTLPNNPMDGGN